MSRTSLVRCFKTKKSGIPCGVCPWPLPGTIRCKSSKEIYASMTVGNPETWALGSSISTESSSEGVEVGVVLVEVGVAARFTMMIEEGPGCPKAEGLMSSVCLLKSKFLLSVDIKSTGEHIRQSRSRYNMQTHPSQGEFQLSLSSRQHWVS